MARKQKDKDKTQKPAKPAEPKVHRDPKYAAAKTEAAKVENVLKVELKRLGDAPVKARAEKLIEANKEERELQLEVGDKPSPELTFEAAMKVAKEQVTDETRKAIIAERKQQANKSGGRQKPVRQTNVVVSSNEEVVSMNQQINTPDAYFEKFGNSLEAKCQDYITEEEMSAKDARVVTIRVPLPDHPGRWEPRQVILTEDNAHLVALNEVETYNLEKGAVKPVLLSTILEEFAKRRDSVETIGNWNWREKPGQPGAIWKTRAEMLGILERLFSFRKSGDQKKDIEALRAVFKDLLCIGGDSFEADSQKMEDFLSFFEEFNSDVKKTISESGRPEGAEGWIGLVRQVAEQWEAKNHRLPFIPITIAWTPYFKDSSLGACVAHPTYLKNLFGGVMEYAGLRATPVPLVKWYVVNKELEAEAVRVQEKRDSYIQENGRDLLAKLQAKIGASPSKQMAEAYQAPTLMDNYRDRGGRRHNERDEPRRGNRGGGRRWDSARHEAADDAE